MSSIGTKVWYVFSFPFGLFIRVVTALRDIVTVWVRCVGRFPLKHDRRLSLYSPSGWASNLYEASLGTLSQLGVVLVEVESLQLSLALSCVLPCPRLWLLVHLHDTCSQSKAVLGTLPLILLNSALQSPARSFLVVLAEVACLREFLDLSFALP